MLASAIKENSVHGFQFLLNIPEELLYVPLYVLVFCFHQISLAEEVVTLISNVVKHQAAHVVRDALPVNTVTVKDSEYLDIIVYQNEQIVLILFCLISFHAEEFYISLDQDLFCIVLRKMLTNIFVFQQRFVVVKKNFLLLRLLREFRVMWPRCYNYIVFFWHAGC